MAKINDGVGSGGTNPSSSNEFNLENEIKKNDLFKDEIDELRGGTIGIEVVRAIKSRFNVGDKDSFDTDPKIDIGADKPRDDPEFDVAKLRKKSDTGLTVQMNRIKLQRNIKG